MQHKNLKQTFFWPTLIGLLSGIGLAAALVKDGLIEQISLIGLSIPLVVMVYFYLIKRS